jgi:hypothetical protein
MRTFFALLEIVSALNNADARMRPLHITNAVIVQNGASLCELLRTFFYYPFKEEKTTQNDRL